MLHKIKLELHNSLKFVKSCGSPNSLTFGVLPMMFGSFGWLSTIWLWICGAVASTLMMNSGDLKSSRLPSILNLNVWFYLIVRLLLWRSCYDMSTIPISNGCCVLSWSRSVLSFARPVQLRKYLTDILLDQLPHLKDLKWVSIPALRFCTLCILQ